MSYCTTVYTAIFINFRPGYMYAFGVFSTQFGVLNTHYAWPWLNTHFRRKKTTSKIAYRCFQFIFNYVALCLFRSTSEHLVCIYITKWKMTRSSYEASIERLNLGPTIILYYLSVIVTQMCTISKCFGGEENSQKLTMIIFILVICKRIQQYKGQYSILKSYKINKLLFCYVCATDTTVKDIVCAQIISSCHLLKVRKFQLNLATYVVPYLFEIKHGIYIELIVLLLWYTLWSCIFIK